MKLTFQTGRVYIANTLERGDKYDKSVVHWLSTLPGEAFLVERKNEAWEVITGVVSVSQGDPVLYPHGTVAKPKDEKPKAAKPKVAKLKDLKPKKKKR